MTADDIIKGPTGKGYKLAESSLIIGTALFAFFLFAELLFLMLGFSVLYKKTNSWQVLIHGMGVLCCLWMILDCWRYAMIWPILVFCGFLPSLMEMVVTFDAVAKSRRESKYQDRIMREMEEAKAK